GPSVPDSNGSSARLPVELSVRVTLSLLAALVFASAFFVSIACSPQRRAIALQYPSAPQHRPLPALNQTPVAAVAAWLASKRAARRVKHQTGPSAISRSRASVSSRPSAAMTSKIGGDNVDPVKAARSGWARAPSFSPRP